LIISKIFQSCLSQMEQNTPKFGLRMPASGDCTDNSKMAQTLKVIINDHSFAIERNYLEHISKRVFRLPKNDDTLRISLPSVQFTNDFLNKWAKILYGAETTDILLDELPFFALLYKEFEIEGKTKIYERCLSDYIEEGISLMLDTNRWITIIELASKLGFDHLFDACMALLAQNNYCLIRELEKPLDISYEYLEKIIYTHNSLREKVDDPERFLQFRDISRFVELQLRNEKDEDKKADIEEGIIRRCILIYGAEAKKERLEDLEQSLDENFNQLRQLQQEIDKVRSDFQKVQHKLKAK
jgi:hypothetical protein